ncbi:transmembrane protein 272-like [Patiria miniata]|uniref:Uncharacterized protein n=1 Tax=Patiria miniata TaxID=46514 RepID=A0A913ZV77_PATMI|nr:transmembrane protein 272-like [Patiria miniata]XP_038055450.1 transmembrane protein 272-like [Patiria miniata]XP_038055451.1 transmembrane protein 272-like [Patiria miniata]XP_038055452.1 transmembrane protein 272-like [Patiria miniata]
MDVKLTSSTPSDYGTNPRDEDDPPPDYDAEASKGDPPSYLSIIDKIEEAKSTSSTQTDFVTTTVKIILNTVMATICLALSMAVPIAMIVMGAVYMNDCPAERMIPIYLTVFGAVYNFKASIDLCNRAIKRKHKRRKLFGSDPQDEIKIVIGLNWFSRLIGILLFGFFIAGNVWVYRIYAPSNNPTSPNYCYGPLYYFAFWVITVVYILLGLCCCGVTTIFCIGFAFCFKILRKVKKFVEALRSVRDAAASARENDAAEEEEEEEDEE